MSGSPIIQDGKLVGAVTHVLVNDPTNRLWDFYREYVRSGSLKPKPPALASTGGTNINTEYIRCVIHTLITDEYTARRVLEHC